MTTTKQEQLAAMIKDCRYMDVIDAPDLTDFSTADELREYIQERIHEHEVIYYSVAMNYLMENDPSLTESLEIADGMGFTCASPLNSETLATLHIQNAMSEELSSLDFDDLFTDDDSEDYADDMAEQFNETGTVATHWDCECAENYIHPKSQQVCLICNADKDEQPDSMADEVAKLQE